MSIATTPGSLYLIATPIGNRDDITFRALEIFKHVDFILAEDTRHTAPLLSYYGIKKPLISLHAHNEASISESIIQRISSGESCALVSDAGTPLINDPGFPLVKLAHIHKISVIPIPGPCALITALSAAGIPCDVFTFGGFLPVKSAARIKKLQDFSIFEQTLVFYESTHRILECIGDIETVLGKDCELVLAKELTKTHERFISGTPQQIIQWLTEDEAHAKGEFVVMIPARSISNEPEAHEVLSILLTELPVKQAVKLASEITRIPKNKLYKQALLQTERNQDE